VIGVASTVLGMVSGLLAGLFGIGGGLVVVPILVFLFSAHGFPPQAIMLMAVSTSLATIILTGFSSTYAHYRHGAVLWRSVFRMTPGIMIGAGLGAALADAMPTQWLKYLFIFYLLCVGTQMAIGATPKPGAIGQFKVVDVIITIMIGLVSALLGIGGGTMNVPYLVYRRYSMHHAVAIASACGLPIAIAGTASYWLLGMKAVGLPLYSLGYVYLPSFLLISLGGVLMAPVGAWLAHRLPAKQLKRNFSVLIFLIAAKMIWYVGGC
jgi:uncharacterized membrane protein YfcA